MLRQLVDTLKEVFWIKPSRKKPARNKVSQKAVKKPPVKKKLKNRQPSRKGSGAILTGKVKVNAIDPSLNEVGAVTHYFDRIKVCVVKVTNGTILIGDKLTVGGPKTKFVQKVWSMQVESVDVKVAKKGQMIGLKVDKIVAVGDKVYK